MTKITTRGSILIAGAAALATPMLITRRALAVTPAEIKSRAKVLIGIQGDNPPWGFVTSAGKQDGLDADNAALNAFIDKIKADGELHAPLFDTAIQLFSGQGNEAALPSFGGIGLRWCRPS